MFPDFFPSAFTESRQQIMSMYSSITSPITPSGTGTTTALSVGDAEGAAVEAEGGVVEEKGVPILQGEEGSDGP